MFKLVKSRQHWDSDTFDDVFREELAQLPADQLVPQAFVSSGHVIVDSSVHAIILGRAENQNSLFVKVMFQYQEALVGYCCGEEEPTLRHACQIAGISIDRASSEAKVKFFSEEEE